MATHNNYFVPNLSTINVWTKDVFQVPKAKGQSPRDSLKIFFLKKKTPYDIIFDKHTLIVLIWKTESYFYCLNLDNRVFYGLLR